MGAHPAQAAAAPEALSCRRPAEQPAGHRRLPASVRGRAGYRRRWTQRESTGIYSKNADNRTAEQRIPPLDEFHRPIASMADELLFEITTNEGEFWIEILSNGERHRLVQGRNARLSADARWLAYVSDESGHNQIYVISPRDRGARWQIAEGFDPVWAPDGAELYYRIGDRLMAAQLATSAGVRVVSGRLVQERFVVPSFGTYDISPDGRTLAMVRPVDPVQGPEVVVAFDWLTEPGPGPQQ